MTERCRSYFRGRGVFVYHGVRCVLDAGHAGRHLAYGNWLQPNRTHRWGRA